MTKQTHGARTGGADTAATGPDTAERFWESFYGESGPRWSGRANPVLVEVVTALPATARRGGSSHPKALDLGCGEGGDAHWLAARGWHVTAIDISATVLARAATRAVDDPTRPAAAAAGAEQAGSTGHPHPAAPPIVWGRHDLARGLPEDLPDGSFDLVSAQFLHSPVDFPRDRVLREAARAVAPGGLLLIVGHAAPPPWAHHQDHDQAPSLPGPDEVLASLALPPGGWRIDRAEISSREAVGPDGTAGVLHDSIVAATRLAGGSAR